MSTKYFALLTRLGADKLANAAALGTKLEITQMAVGDGGGSLPTPDTTQTKLTNKRRRAAINVLSIDPKNTHQIIAEQVIPESEGGWWIREIGLFDKDGILIAAGNCAETYKPQLQEGSGRTQTIRMVLIVSHTNAVTLKIDPSVVLATREYADTVVAKAISEHEKSRRHPDATLKEKGLVILSSATNSNSESHAATPRAIQAVYDVAKNAVPITRKINGKSLSSDVNLTAGDVGGLSVFGGTLISDNKIIELKNATPGAANYIYGIDSGGSARYLLGCGTGADHVAIVNARTDTHLIVGDKHAFIDGKEIATVKTVNDNANGRVPVTRKINGQSLSSDVNLTAGDVGALSVFGGALISDNKIIELKNATPNAANYIQGTDINGISRYRVGCGNGTSNVSIVNARTDTHLIVGDKHAFIDGKEIATLENIPTIPKNTLMKSTTGYWRCADTGLILQWGTITRAGSDMAFIQFPTLFSTECVNVQMTVSGSVSGASTSNVQSRDRTQTGFTAIMGENETQCNWFAVGY
ncbi:phage tail protein [Xenorhabdus sp. XENO-1]|uniref:phage tail-collar fiber domain-containing protein n=1 Tax=Xenorhabdus bovienii TaxID=40576 RepID=UPI0020CA2E3D|nr:phage tail protein [Xenorhabdus bovienii]MCP9269361.1 phage tail protein [Xenorhabdus bovienii subsp. africana]